MMNAVVGALILFSTLIPTKSWFLPGQQVDVKVDGSQQVRLVARTFGGKELEPAASADVTGGQTIDLAKVYPQITQPGTYVVLAVAPGKPLTEFTGTPLVIEARASPKQGARVGLNVVKVSPLTYARIETDKGSMKAIFWYDVAPVTVNSFLDLAHGGFFDGSSFHRIVPEFVIQGGDPTGTGFGGPGYSVQAEFNDRPHDVGVLSMARTGDPLEGRGISPRPEYANSAGSQFFICLSRERCQALDRKYTAFGKIVEGMDTVKSIANVPLADPDNGTPKERQGIKSVKAVPVTASDNPYVELLKLDVESGPAATTPAR